VKWMRQIFIWIMFLINYKVKNVKNIISKIQDNYPVKHYIHLILGGCRISVGANEKAVTENLLEYFKPFINTAQDAPDICISVHESQPLSLPFTFTVKEPDPGKTKIKEEYIDVPPYRVVRKRLTDMIFIFGDGDHVATGPCLKNMNQIVNFINNRYIEWKLCQGGILGHAAGVIYNGKGLALAGFSGAGKSTLSLHLMNHGAVFVSNDRLMIEKRSENLFMYGVAKLPRINPGTVLNNPNLIGIMTNEEQKNFSELPAEELWQLEHKYDAPIDQCFGADRFILDSQMHGLVILNWKKNNKDTNIQQVDLNKRRDLLPAFMKSTGLFFTPYDKCRMPEPTEENYIAHLSLCKVWEITGGIDFEKAAEKCIRELDM